MLIPFQITDVDSFFHLPIPLKKANSETDKQTNYETFHMIPILSLGKMITLVKNYAEAKSIISLPDERISGWLR